MNVDILNYQCSGPHLHFLHEPSHADHHLLLIPGKARHQTLFALEPPLPTLSGRRQPWSRTRQLDRLAGLCIVGSMTTAAHIFQETIDNREINLTNIVFQTRGWRQGRRWRWLQKRRPLCSGSPSPHSAQTYKNKLASLEATLPWNLLTGFKCRATSVAKN